MILKLFAEKIIMDLFTLEVLWLFSFIFDDFGEKHTINNWNRNTSNLYYIKNITNKKNVLLS